MVKMAIQVDLGLLDPLDIADILERRDVLEPED